MNWDTVTSLWFAFGLGGAFKSLTSGDNFMVGWAFLAILLVIVDIFEERAKKNRRRK